jgi:hypothetical protein
MMRKIHYYSILSIVFIKVKQDITMNEELEYRGYVFVNSALSSIQKGVQGAHAMVEVTNRYNYSSVTYDEVPAASARVVWDWRNEHKTLIFLEAGFHRGLLENYLTFAQHCEKLGLPYALFVEDDDTMNSMATAFAGVVPSSIYDIDLNEYDMVKSTPGMFMEVDDPDDVALCRFLKQFHLAR